MTDQDLANACLQGKREAQKLLFDRYAGKMLSVCKRYFDSIEQAEDALQEGFIKVFEKLHQWNGTGSLGGWIRTVMVNTSLTHIRAEKKWADTSDVEEIHGLESEEINAMHKMQADDILTLIEKMPIGYRTVFNLFAIEGYGHKEIADMMGISENTSKTQYLKSKEWLKKALSELEKKIG